MSSGTILLLLVALSVAAYWLKQPNKAKSSPSTQRGWGRVEYFGAGMDGEARIAKIGDMPVVYGGSGMEGRARIEYIGTR